jgi:phage FluMu protein Com/uncharacterized protein YlzI (FlbEa/FlbD family)
MFENCTILNECEEVILQNLKGVSFLGQIELSSEDVDKLGTLIKNKMSDDPAFGIEQIEKYTPACLCLYLVWKGILNYNSDKADYWTVVSDELSVSDINLQTRMGKIFIDFISSRNLKNIDVEDSYQYVTPILFQGGIPQNCLTEYFEKFILPKVKIWKGNKGKIKDYLFTLRIHENKKRIIRKEITDIRNQINNYSRIINAIRQKEEQYQKYFTLLEYKKNISSQIRDVNNYMTEFKDKYLSGSNLTIEECMKNLHEYIKQCERLKDIDIKIKQNRRAADVCLSSLKQQCSDILISEWNFRRFENIFEIDPDILAEKIEAYHTTIAQNATQMNSPLFKPIELIGAVAIFIIILFLTIPHKTLFFVALSMFICSAYVIRMLKRSKKKKQREYEATITKRDIIQYLTDIPIKEDIFVEKDFDVPGIIRQIRSAYSKHQELSKEHEDYLQNKNTIEKMAAALLRDTFPLEETTEITHFNDFEAMFKTVKDIICQYMQLEKNMNQELDKLYQSEMKTDIDIRRMKRNLFRDTENVPENDEMLQKPENDFGYEDYIKGINQKIGELKARVQLKENTLFYYSQSIGLLNEPVYRFIVFGGSWAEMIIVESVELMTNTMNNVPSSDICSLPERITQAFYSWYATYIKRVTSDSQSNDGRLKDKRQEIIVSPDIVYDNAVGGVKIVMGSQQLLGRENTGFDIYLDIEYLNPLIEKQHVPIYAVNSDDFIQTEPCEQFLNDLFGEISITLSAGKKYVWKYTLLTDSSPFLAFNEKGKIINSQDISGKLVWLILTKGYTLYDKSLIIEESVAGENTFNYLIDLYGEENLKLLRSDGSELVLGISNSNFFSPYIEGGEISNGITFSGEKVYKQKPEYLVIPSDEDHLKYWSITISNYDGFERQHFTTADLVEVEKHEGKAKVSLSKNRIIQENQQGKCTLYLYYRNRKPYVFEVNIIHDLYLCQKPGFFAMPLNSNSTVDFELSLPVNANIEYKTQVTTEEKIENIHKITTRPGTGFVEGTFKMKLSGDIYFVTPVTIEIPIVRWRINDLPEYKRWSCCCEELWLGKWNDSDKLVLEIYVPSDLFRYLRLYIGQYDHVKTLEINNRIASTDIKGFYDSLKTGENSKKMFIDLFNKENKVRAGCLFSIQCKWEVVNFKYTLDDTDDRRKLTFLWNEKGIGRNRAIRIWKTWEPQSKPITFPIPDDDFTLSLERDRQKIPDGEYLLQFIILDPWENEVLDDSIPTVKMNTFNYTLSDGTTHIHDWKAVWRGVNQVNITGNIANATEEHMITVRIYGIYQGDTYSFVSSGQSSKGGSFNICVRNNADGIILKNIAHWIGFFLDSANGFYEYYLMPDPACLNWNFRDISAESLKNRERNFEIIMKTADGYTDSYILNPQAAQRMIESIINKQNIQLDVTFGYKEKAKLVYQADHDEIYLNVARGVKCCSCGKILSNQQEWFTHAHITRCKGLNTSYSKAAISLYIMWRSRISKEFLNRHVLLFSSRCNPISDGYKIFMENKEQITKLLWEREKAFME